MDLADDVVKQNSLDSVETACMTFRPILPALNLFSLPPFYAIRRSSKDRSTTGAQD
jgi:hypothetical protein